MKKYEIKLFRPDGGVEISYGGATCVHLPSPSYPYLSFKDGTGSQVMTNLQYTVREK